MQATPLAAATPLAGHAGIVNAVAISGDGKRLVTGSDDKTARVWPLRIQEVLDQAERAVGRNFTREVGKELFPDEPYRKTFERLPAPPEPTPTRR